MPSWDPTAAATAQALQALHTAGTRIRARYREYADRIDADVEWCRREDVRVAQAITDAKGNRAASPSGQDDPDLYTRIVKYAVASHFRDTGCISRARWGGRRSDTGEFWSVLIDVVMACLYAL